MSRGRRNPPITQTAGREATQLSPSLPAGTSKELAVIKDTRPYIERVWDVSGRETWEQRTLEALQHSDINRLITAITVLEWTHPMWTSKPNYDSRVQRPTRPIWFDIDIIDKHFEEEQTLR